MTDKLVYGVAEGGTWQTSAPTPHVDLSGSTPNGVSIAQAVVDAVANGETINVTVRKDTDNWSCYGYASGSAGSAGPALITGSPNKLDFSSATLRDSKGSIANGEAVDVTVETPESDAFIPGGVVSYWDNLTQDIGNIANATPVDVDSFLGHKIICNVTASVTVTINIQSTMNDPDFSIRVQSNNGQTVNIQVNGVTANTPTGADVSATGEYLYTVMGYNGLTPLLTVAGYS